MKDKNIIQINPEPKKDPQDDQFEEYIQSLSFNNIINESHSMIDQIKNSEKIEKNIQEKTEVLKEELYNRIK